MKRKMQQEDNNVSPVTPGEDFRAMLSRMEAAGHVKRTSRPVKPQHFSALCTRAPGVFLAEKVEGYDFSMVGGVFWTRARTAASMGWPEAELGRKFAAGVSRPFAPVEVSEAPCHENVVTHDDVDLSAIPIPLMHEKDGGPYLSSGIVFADEPGVGVNVG